MRVQDMFSAAGPQAERILNLWWVTLAICLVVFAAVMAAYLLALRPKREISGTDRGAKIAVASAVAASGVGLLFLIFASAATDRALADLPVDNAVEIDVIAHKWWWEARYKHGDPSRLFTVANELHIPVGRPVLLTLKGDDVIHSFWVPNLGAKKDLIPGREAKLALRADRAGAYRGQCAEFCGTQHAKMAFQVFAEPSEQYEAWAERQRQGAPEPADDAQRRGKELFERGTCAMCHTVQGTQAQGRKAPDLTHLASRATLAAGTLPNTRGHLAGWIVDPHSIKPGVNMPSHTTFTPDELQALLAFLESLK